MSMWHLFFRISTLWSSNAVILNATDCLNAAVAVKYEKVNNLSIYLITFFFPSSVNILVWIIKKAIALKFADPLVKLFLLACPLRIWLSDWDHHSHLLWSSPHIFAQSSSSTNNVIFVQLHTTLVTTTLTVFNLWLTHLFLTWSFYVWFTSSHLFVQRLTQTWVPMLEFVDQH